MMSSTLIFAVLCLSGAVYCMPSSVSEATGVKSPIEHCAELNNVNAEKGLKLAKHIVRAEAENEKCFLSCYLKARGYIVNGKVEFDKLLDSHKRYVPKDEIGVVEAVFADCKRKIIYEGRTECDIAFQAYNCFP